MDADGSNVQRMTDGGYATSPSWSPNGQFLAFAWDRKYGPGAPGGQDIYVMEIATKRWIQLTHDIGRCDFPSWSPDGRHIVYANSADGRAATPHHGPCSPTAPSARPHRHRSRHAQLELEVKISPFTSHHDIEYTRVWHQIISRCS
jgi:dipeptidyl aminopeptidase/acylaminoacyl peptidase